MTRSSRETTLNLTGSAGLGNAGEGRASPRGDAAAARAIHTAYDRWIRGFEEITRRARERFERRDWRGAQADATARLALYRIHLDGAVADVGDILEDAVLERTRWAAVKARHQEGLAGRTDAELARTFFNSVTRRIFSTVGADPAIEYLDPPPDTARGRNGQGRSRGFVGACESGLCSFRGRFRRGRGPDAGKRGRYLRLDSRSTEIARAERIT